MRPRSSTVVGKLYYWCSRNCYDLFVSGYINSYEYSEGVWQRLGIQTDAPRNIVYYKKKNHSETEESAD